jgi:hypothetical protein
MIFQIASKVFEEKFAECHGGSLPQVGTERTRPGKFAATPQYQVLINGVGLKGSMQHWPTVYPPEFKIPTLAAAVMRGGPPKIFSLARAVTGADCAIAEQSPLEVGRLLFDTREHRFSEPWFTDRCQPLDGPTNPLSASGNCASTEETLKAVFGLMLFECSTIRAHRGF